MDVKISAWVPERVSSLFELLGEVLRSGALGVGSPAEVSLADGLGRERTRPVGTSAALISIRILQMMISDVQNPPVRASLTCRILASMCCLVPLPSRRL